MSADAAATDASALQELVDAWVVRWASGRGIALARTPTGWAAEVGAASRSREHVAVSPTDAQADALVAIAEADPEAWVTVLGAVPDALPTRLATVTLGEESLMRTTLRAGAVAPHVALGVGEAVTTATVRVDGALASSGRVAVDGDTAVFDKVETGEAFRRRGLGRAVMAALEHHAASRGAQHGLLIASPEGRALYERMGWSVVAPLAIFRARHV